MDPLVLAKVYIHHSATHHLGVYTDTGSHLKKSIRTGTDGERVLLECVLSERLDHDGHDVDCKSTFVDESRVLWAKKSYTTENNFKSLVRYYHTKKIKM